MKNLKRADNDGAAENKTVDINFPEYWPAVQAKLEEMTSNGAKEHAGYYESLQDPGIHTLVIGIPGSGYESLASRAAVLANMPWVCGDRLGYRAQTTNPAEWSYDLDALLWHMKNNRTPSVYTFGGSGAANILFLPWAQVIALYPESSEQYCRQVVEWRRKNGLSDLPVGFNRFAELEKEFIRSVAEITATLRMGRNTFTRFLVKPNKWDENVERIQTLLKGRGFQARQNPKHSLAAICHNRTLYIRQRTSGKWMSSTLFGCTPEFSQAYAMCTEPLDGKTAENIYKLIEATPEKEGLFSVTTESNDAASNSSIRLVDATLWVDGKRAPAKLVMWVVPANQSDSDEKSLIVVDFDEKGNATTFGVWEASYYVDLISQWSDLENTDAMPVSKWLIDMHNDCVDKGEKLVKSRIPANWKVEDSLRTLE